MKKTIKAWIIEDGKWSTSQMLVYQTRKAAKERMYYGCLKNWKVYRCEIIIKK